MKVRRILLASALCGGPVSSFIGPSSLRVVVVTRSSLARSKKLTATTPTNLDDFSVCLEETTTNEMLTAQAPPMRSRRRIALASDRSTVLASSNTFAGGAPKTFRDELNGGDDPYADLLDQQDNAGMSKIQMYQQQQKPTLEQRFKKMDLQDIVATLVLPSIVLFAGGRWIYNRVSRNVGSKVDGQLDAFATELLYHDGDFTEMQLCIQDYKSKLVYVPNRSETMLKRYLAAYAKKKTVSPQAISSISYVFTCFNLSEERAAQLLVRLCRELGPDKSSSAAKLLFLGTRILRSPSGQQALQPIKELIMGTYRGDERVVETLVETSQQAMAEASYRTVVQRGGKQQSSLTPGWQVLGLEQEVAQRIYDELKKEGFLTDRETMYGGQTQRYDKKGRKIGKDGKLENPADGDDDDEFEDDGGPTSNVYECGDCGYTLFVAQGRESKFFGQGFRCPDCGASKKKFKARDDIDDDDELSP